MARGGKRAGVVGRPYPNRADLQQNTRAPATAPTGLPYGEHQQLVQAQKVVPVASPPTPGQAPGGPAPQPQPQHNVPPPGSLPWMHPTQRPNEPVQAGLPTGPGPGPEALQGVGRGMLPAPDSAANVVRTAASQPNASPDVQALAQIVNAGMR